MQTKTIVEVVEENNLLEQVQNTGIIFYKGLKKIEKNDQRLSSTRGIGTFLAIDCINTKFRDDFIKKLRNNGLSIGPCGSNSIRLRPSLTFHQKHVKLFLDIFENTLKEMH